MPASLKKLFKSIKYGVKISKGIADVSTANRSQSVRDLGGNISQGIAALVSPIIFFLGSKIFGGLSREKKLLMEFGFSIGLSIGGYWGALASYTFLSDLPSSFNNALGLMGGILLTGGLFLVGNYIHRIIQARRVKKPNFNHSDEENETFISKKVYKRFTLGLEVGALLGSALGASVHFIHAGMGIAAAAVATIIMAPLMGMAFCVAPSLMHYFNLSKQIVKGKTLSVDNFKNGLGLGSSYGAAVGVVIGIICFPGLGSVLGGLIGGGIGGLVAGIALAGIPVLKDLEEMALYVKVGAPIGAAIGSVIGTFFFPGIGTVCGAAVGTLLAIAGGILSVTIMSYFTQNKPAMAGEISELNQVQKEKQASFKASCQRDAKNAVSLGVILGGLIGGIIGTCLPLPGGGTLLGALVGSTFFSVVALAVCLSVNGVKYLAQPSSLPSISASPPPSLAYTHAKISKALEKAEPEPMPVEIVVYKPAINSKQAINFDWFVKTIPPVLILPEETPHCAPCA